MASHAADLVDAVADRVVDLGDGPGTSADDRPPRAAAEVARPRGDIRALAPRPGRHPPSPRRSGDAYIAVFAALMLGSMVVSVLVNLRLVSDEPCTASGCQDARALLPWLVVIRGARRSCWPSPGCSARSSSPPPSPPGC